MPEGITRRGFNTLMASGFAAVAAGPARADDGVDVPWRSADPHLSGNFLPVQRETDAADLKVIAGRIPPELRGTYLRNGPNPLFEPLAFTYPLDGDGMIHAVQLEDGRARYRNRFVRTRGLAVEQRLGRAVYGSFAKPMPIDTRVLLPGEPAAPFKNGAFVNIIRHGGRLLALNEAITAYEMSPALETLGEWTAGTAQPIRLGAHSRRHPRSGALFALQYDWREPLIHFHQIDAGGTLVRTLPVPMVMPTMVHDFVLTEGHIVLIAGPAVFDAEAARAGRSMLQWRPDLGMRVALIPLDGGAVRWIEGDAFFVFHFANGFERGGRIVVDVVHHEAFSLGPASGGPPTLRRMSIDPVRGSFRVERLSERMVEFPRVNDRLEALPTRHVYLPTRTAALTLPNPPSAAFNTMLKCDTDTGRLQSHDFGNRLVGEGAFVARPGATREDDGYIATFVYDPATQGSTLVLLHADRIEEAPAAVIQMPQRVPQGLHGNWIADV